MTSREQPEHLMPMSEPILVTVKLSLPQGCFFFNVSVSPTAIGIIFMEINRAKMFPPPRRARRISLLYLPDNIISLPHSFVNMNFIK